MKSQRACQFLVVLLLILPTAIFSQQEMPRIEQENPHISRISIQCSGKVTLKEVVAISQLQKFACHQGTFQIACSQESSRLACSKMIALPGISPVSFFCKTELQFEKNTSIPLRLRLGSLQYVDWLEGKK